MAIWLIRAGSHGEFEQKFLQDKRVYVTWNDLGHDLSKMADRKHLFETLTKLYPDAKTKKLHNWVGQIWPFAHVMTKGDWIVLPLKSKPVVYVGEIIGDYVFDKSAANPFYHARSVKWIGTEIPRSHFGKDLLFSFGAFLTICRIQRNNAEVRLKAMQQHRWEPEKALSPIAKTDEALESLEEETDLEELARDDGCVEPESLIGFYTAYFVDAGGVLRRRRLHDGDSRHALRLAIVGESALGNVGCRTRGVACRARGVADGRGLFHHLYDGHGRHLVLHDEQLDGTHAWAAGHSGHSAGVVLRA